MPSSERAILFVDGANLYRGLKELGLVPRHIDIERVARKLAMDRELVQVRYYIAEVDPSGGRAHHANRDLIADLRARPLVELVLGYIQRTQERSACAQELRQFLASLGDVRLPKKVYDGLMGIAQRHDRTVVYREKGVDVALACDLVDLALADKYDLAYVMSGDGDFVPAARMAQASGKRVFAACPTVGNRLQRQCDKAIRLKAEWFGDCRI